MSDWRDTHDIVIEPPPKVGVSSQPVYNTKLGAMFCGDSSKLLRSERLKRHVGNVQLVFTSPPFPLNTKKRYGNLQGEEYIEWFARFANPLKKFLTRDGSIVIEIGNAWELGRPVMSTVVLRALLRFLERGGLKLCQEFVWYNPARLPSPVQWVNVERIRVKDAFTRIWWMSTTDRPKADNRKVLREYSPSMKKLIASGKYNSGARPSQHNIGKDSFKTDNAGAIPPNVMNGDAAIPLRASLNGQSDGSDRQMTITTLLKGTNTHSYERYQSFCRSRAITLHPARMPPDLVEFFIRFLTEERDLVLDPFGGSNTTGAVAEDLNRKWLTLEADWNYASSSIGRFDPDSIRSTCKHLSVHPRLYPAASTSSVLTPVRTS